MSDLGYARFSTPLGDVLVVSTRFGLVRLAYDDEPTDRILDELARRLESTPRVGSMTDERRQVDEYFAGRRRVFDIPIDTALVPTDFARRVLRATAGIAFGETATYGEIAELAGAPRGARAAGNALNGNPVPLVIPCHRVIPAGNKGIGGYAGREDRKAFLLRLEGSIPEPGID